MRYEAPANGAPPSALVMISSAMARALPKAFMSENFLRPAASSLLTVCKSPSGIIASAAHNISTEAISLSRSPDTAS